MDGHYQALGNMACSDREAGAEMKLRDEIKKMVHTGNMGADGMKTSMTLL